MHHDRLATNTVKLVRQIDVHIEMHILGANMTSSQRYMARFRLNFRLGTLVDMPLFARRLIVACCIVNVVDPLVSMGRNIRIPDLRAIEEMKTRHQSLVGPDVHTDHVHHPVVFRL
jgi:hypothetical protein